MQFLHRNFVLAVFLLALFCVPMPAFAALDTLTVTIDETDTDLQAFSDGDAIYMKSSDIAELFEVEYTQDMQKGNVTYTLDKTLFGKKEAVFTVDSDTALINGKKVVLDNVPMVADDTVLIPVKAAFAIWEASYGANEAALYIHTDGSDVTVPEIQKAFVEKQSVTVGDKKTVIRYIRIPDMTHVKAELVLAQNTVGKVEELDSMATRTSAKAAINGGFFQSFDATKAQEPYGILMKDGKLMHSDNTGSTLAFMKDGSVRLDIVRSVIKATIDDIEYAVSLLNHSPALDSNVIALFTSAYGEAVNTTGTAVTIQNGVVTALSNAKTVTIPKDGYVLIFTGEKAALTEKIEKGYTASYNVSYTTTGSTKIDWANVQTAIGAGPILVKNGAIVLDPAKEGFTDETSFQIAVPRSAVGVTEDGTILLTGNIKCTAQELADIMLELGAVQAIAMDSGSSSGLYISSGDAVAAPMKAISNALIFK